MKLTLNIIGYLIIAIVGGVWNANKLEKLLYGTLLIVGTILTTL